MEWSGTLGGERESANVRSCCNTGLLFVICDDNRTISAVLLCCCCCCCCNRTHTHDTQYDGRGEWQWQWQPSPLYSFRLSPSLSLSHFSDLRQARCLSRTTSFQQPSAPLTIIRRFDSILFTDLLLSLITAVPSQPTSRLSILYHRLVCLSDSPLLAFNCLAPSV